jgi:hypothetical protein
MKDKPTSIVPVHPKMWEQVTEERVQYRDALEKTKKNMMEMERDLYLKINDLEEQLAKEISEMSDEEMKENVDKNFHYWQNRKAELQRSIDNNEIFTITEEDQKQEIIFLKQERERLIKKLEKIDNLSRYAWEQVKRNPQEAEELFKMINKESK